MDKSFNEFPEIAEAWVTYNQCRKQEIIRIEQQKGTGRSPVTEVKLLPRTNGYNILPWEGGLLDQPYRLFIFFDAFQHGESEAFNIKAK